MEDVQNRADHREIDIDKVGVRDLQYPITILDRENEKQHTVAKLSMSVNLPRQFKGTHMSRFLEVLNKYRGEITLRTLPKMLGELRQRLDAEAAHVEVHFPFFIEKTAPVSGAKSLMDFEGYFIAHESEDEQDYLMGLVAPVKSLCPCSKAISDYGAHNQRSHVTIEIRSPEEGRLEQNFVWFEELIEVAEASASAPLYPLLKRPDERHVTMQAYENPVFVEDIVRNVAHRLKQDKRVRWFRVASVNQESIHNHNAFAEIEWTRPA